MRKLALVLALFGMAQPACITYYQNSIPNSNGYAVFVQYRSMEGSTKIFTFPLGQMIPTSVGWDDKRFQRCF